MQFLIDGHNLIPKIPGLSLQEMDDEQQLIILLQEFCRLQRKQVEVFFDQAATTETRARSYGSVLARLRVKGSAPTRRFTNDWNALVEQPATGRSSAQTSPFKRMPGLFGRALYPQKNSPHF